MPLTCQSPHPLKSNTDSPGIITVNEWSVQLSHNVSSARLFCTPRWALAFAFATLASADLLTTHVAVCSGKGQ